MKKILVLLASIAIFTNLLSAQQETKEKMPMRGKGIVKVLKLTEDQEKKFDNLNYEHQKVMIDVRAKIQKNQIELKKMLEDGNIDDKKLLQLTNDNSKLQGEMKEMGVKKWIEINKILDKDQKPIWTKHLLRMGAEMKMMKGREQDGPQRFMMERKMKNNRHIR